MLRVWVECREKPFHGCDERRQIAVDCCLDDGSGGVEVTVRKVIAHPGDIDPWDGRLLGEELRVDGSHRFADLDEPHSDRIED